MDCPAEETRFAQDTLQIRQLTLPDFEKHQMGIQALLQQYQHILADDFTNPMDLLPNLASCIPFLWVITNKAAKVYGLCCLADVIPGRHAYIHGAAHPSLRRNPIIDHLVHMVLALAFEQLRVHKVKAEFDTNNKAVKGFCFRMGFTKEALLKEDTQLAGKKQDVALYSLFADRYRVLTQQWSQRDA